MHPLGGWQSVAIRACSPPHLQPQQRRNWLSSMEPTLGTRWRPHSDNLLTPAWKNPPMRAQPTSWSIASCQKRVLLTGAPVSAVLCSCMHTERKYKSTVWNWWGVNMGSKESLYLWYFDIIDTLYFYIFFYILPYKCKSNELFKLFIIACHPSSAATNPPPPSYVRQSKVLMC